MKDRVIRFCYWPDGSLTVLRREYRKEYDNSTGKYAGEKTLSESTDTTVYTSDEVNEMRKAIQAVRS